MSEQANVQVVQAAYVAFTRGDIQSILNTLSDDVEWIEPPVEPLGGTYRGREGVAKFFQKVSETSDFSSFEPREFVAQGDRVVALGHYSATVRATGRVYGCDWAMVFTFTNGKISRFQEFTDTAAYAAALGTAASAATA
jgi:ketosteroid isomerase-like protein